MTSARNAALVDESTKSDSFPQYASDTDRKISGVGITPIDKAELP
jgi:hypothetical protein